MSKKKKPIVFFDSFAEQERYGLLASLEMSVPERLSAMYELNERFYESYGKVRSKTIELFVAQPGESVNDFYRRINGGAQLGMPGQEPPSKDT